MLHFFSLNLCQGYWFSFALKGLMWPWKNVLGCPCMDCTRKTSDLKHCYLLKTEWMDFFFKKNFISLSFISGSYVTNLLGRVSSSLKSAFAEVDSQHSCNNSRHDDSEDSCHQTWHIHSRCVTFKDKHCINIHNITSTITDTRVILII